MQPFDPEPSPYDPPGDVSEPESDIVEATLVSAEPVEPVGLRQRIASSPGLMWLLVAVTIFASVMLFLLTSGVAAVVALIINNGGSFPGAMDQEALTSLMETRTGLTLSVAVPQLSLLVFPVIACFFLPAGPRKSLRLVRGNWPLWGWIAAGLATPVIGTLASLVMAPFIEESETLEAMTSAFRHHATSGFLIPLVLMIGVTPSICEEILFRGFLQPRLTRLMPPFLGVFLASVAFAAMHMDPVHVLGVVPLGLWLGFLSYRSGSLFPAMLGHLVNNVLSVISVIPEDTGALDAPDFGMTAAIFGVGILGMIGVGAASYFYRGNHQSESELANI